MTKQGHLFQGIWSAFLILSTLALGIMAHAMCFEPDALYYVNLPFPVLSPKVVARSSR